MAVHGLEPPRYLRYLSLSMKIRAVFFDLDDTLVAFDAVTESSWRDVVGGYCAGKPGLNSSVVYDRIHECSSRYWSDPERHRVGRLDIVAARKAVVLEAFTDLGLPEADAEKVAVDYSRIRLENMYLFPGARETLDAIRARGFPMALLTNGDSETQRNKIRRFGLDGYFKAVLIEGELGYGKPDPRVYLDALSAVGVSPENAMMVGDNPEWDIEAAQRQGIKAAWIKSDENGDPGSRKITPDWTIGSVAELPKVLDL